MQPSQKSTTLIQKIKVVDPTHPLFDRSFNVLEWCNLPGSQGFVYVEYRHLCQHLLSFILEPETITLNIEDGRMMKQTIENSSRKQAHYYQIVIFTS